MGGRYHQRGESLPESLANATGISFYCWPSEQRPAGALLHAKAVIADGRSALITSANLTEHAIDANIEIGVLIKGGPLPERLRAHLISLIDSGVFRELRS